MNKQLLKRIKSFVWRGGAVVLAFAIDWVLVNLGILELPDVYTIIFGGLLGEVSKYLNNKSLERKVVNKRIKNYV